MAKKKSPKPIEVVVVLDRSGSMQSMRADAIGGYNAFVAEQKNKPGKCRISLLQFDDEHQIDYQGIPVEEVEPLTEETFVPRGWTALRDAIARGVALLSDRVEDGVLGALAILTDGRENSSEISSDGLKILLVDCESKGWGVLYLGANQDAVEVGASLGINVNRAATFTGDNVVKAYEATSQNLSAFRRSGGAMTSLSFSDGQRGAMAGDGDLIGTTEAAAAIGVSRSTLLRREKDGTGPPATRLGGKGHRRYRRGALRKYLSEE